MEIDYLTFTEMCSSYILNTLDETEYKKLKEILDSGDKTAQKIFKEQIKALLYIAESVEQTDPPAGIKTELFNKIKAKKNDEKEINLLDADYSKNFSFVISNQGEWVKHPVEGVNVKILSVNKEKNYSVMLYKVDADTFFPPHHHSGAEECYVISGDLYVADKILVPGDFHHADEDSNHGTQYTKSGCTLLIMAALDDYYPH